jgi:hypothetical protein
MIIICKEAVVGYFKVLFRLEYRIREFVSRLLYSGSILDTKKWKRAPLASPALRRKLDRVPVCPFTL